ITFLMLFIVGTWLLICGISIPIGMISWSVLAKIFRTEESYHSIGIHHTVVLGLMFISFLAQIASIFIRLNIEFFSFLLLLASILLLFYWYKWKITFKTGIAKIKALPWWIVSIWLCFGFMALLHASGMSDIEDEGEYYMPFIQWMVQYPLIPGLANIEDRIGFNSSFHVLSAVFHFPFLLKGGTNDLNALIGVLFSFYCLKGFSRLWKRDHTYFLADFLKPFALILPFRSYFTASAADYSIIFLGLWFFFLFLEKTEDQTLGKCDYRSLLLFSLFMFLTTTKFISLFFGFFLVPILFPLIQANPRRLISIALFGIIYFTPWLYRNYILSGYLVYPIYIIDLFDPNWKVPISVAAGQYNYVSEHATYGYSREINCYEITPIIFSEWFPMWLENIPTRLHSILVVFGLATTLLILPFRLILYITGNSKIDSSLLLALLLPIPFLLIWFFRYPDVRFGWAWIFFFVNLHLLTLFQFLIRKNLRPILILVLVILIASSVRNLIFPYHIFSSNVQYTTLPRLLPIKTSTQLTLFLLNRTPIHVSNNNSCWSTPQPCFPKDFHKRIQMRGGHLTDGFKIPKE
ncbi:MAG: hypothetical protein AAF798_08765, partial [Bacteroidota bacterium]